MEKSISTATSSIGTLTIEVFREMVNKYFPVLYYATDKNIEPGTLFTCKASEHNPECIILHPDDLDDVRNKITARRLVHISDEPKEAILERLRKAYPLGSSLEFYSTTEKQV